MFYPLAKPLTLHIELSTKCNAACPMCSRNRGGFGVNPRLQPVNLTLRDLVSNLSGQFIKGLSRLLVCGNFGDPLMNPEIVPIFQFFKEVNPSIKIELHTNGGIGSKETWRQLAGLVHFCRFGIDGLEDTNHLYRRGVKWTALQQNVADFVTAGGVAEWAFLVFKHNQHQLREAEELSTRLGFSKFIPKRTTRNILSDGTYVENWPVHVSENEIGYYLEPPDDEKYEQNLAQFKSSQSDFANYQHYLERTKINCKIKHDKSVYLAADGTVLPCCWLGIDFVLNEAKGQSVRQLLADIEISKESLNFLNNDIADIVAGEFFAEVEARWSSLRRPRKCAQICGEGFDRFSVQF